MIYRMVWIPSPSLKSCPIFSFLLLHSTPYTLHPAFYMFLSKCRVCVCVFGAGGGAMMWVDGTKLEGQWDEGRRVGSGVLTFANGTRFEVAPEAPPRNKPAARWRF